MSWFVLTELPWEGIVVQRFEDEAKAREKYEEDRAKVGVMAIYDAVALIEGRVVEESRFDWSG